MYILYILEYIMKIYMTYIINTYIRYIYNIYETHYIQHIGKVFP